MGGGGEFQSQKREKLWCWETSLVVQWQRLHSPSVGGPGSIPGQGTRSHTLQLRAGAAKINKYIILKKGNLGWGIFPGGSMVKNPPASAGDTGFNPWSRKITQPRSN